jgi:hypothetical protein
MADPSGTALRQEVIMKGSFTAAAVVTLLCAGGCSQPASPTSPTTSSSAIESPLLAGGQIPAAPASAAAVPFKGTFEGTQAIVPPNQVNGTATGTGTHLGQFTVAFPHTVNFATRVGTGTYTFTAADGDTITASFQGQAQGAPPLVSIVEHATVTGGTGRFAGATGAFTAHRTFNQTTGVTTGSFEGTLLAVGAGRP